MESNKKPCNVNKSDRCKKDAFIDARYLVLGAIIAVILAILGFSTLLTSIIVLVPIFLFIAAGVAGIATFAYAAQPIRY